MKNNLSDEDVRRILTAYSVKGPRASLLAETKRLMREELLYSAAQAEEKAPAHAGPVMLLSGLALVLTMNLFYSLAIGTVLRFTLPEAWTVYVTRSLFWMPLAGVSMLVGTLLVITFKMLQPQAAPEQGERFNLVEN